MALLLLHPGRGGKGKPRRARSVHGGEGGGEGGEGGEGGGERAAAKGAAKGAARAAGAAHGCASRLRFSGDVFFDSYCTVGSLWVATWWVVH